MAEFSLNMILEDEFKVINFLNNFFVFFNMYICKKSTSTDYDAI